MQFPWREPSAIVVIAFHVIMGVGCTDPTGAPTDAGDAGSDVDAQSDSGGGDRALILRIVPAAPPWIAVQNGPDGTWARVEDADGDGEARIELASDAFGVAVACSWAPAWGRIVGVRVLWATLSEAATLDVGCDPTTDSRIEGSVAGLAPSQSATIFAANTVATATAAAPAWEIPAPTGTWRVVVARVGTGPLQFDRIVRRTVTLPGAAPIAVDLALDGVTPVTRSVTIEGVASGESVTTGCSIMHDGVREWFNQSTDGTYQGLGVTDRELGDQHYIGVSAEDAAASTLRTAARILIEPVDLTLALPAPPDAPVIDVLASTPNLLLRASIAAPADCAAVQLGLVQDDLDGSLQWALIATRGWLDASGATSLSTPDFAGMAGFDASWALSAGAMQWDYQVFRSTRPISEIVQHVVGPPSGARYTADDVEETMSLVRGEITP